MFKENFCLIALSALCLSPLMADSALNSSSQITSTSSMTSIATAAIDHLSNAKQWLDSAPDWGKRIRLNYSGGQYTKPDFSMETIQPIFTSAMMDHHVFIQFEIQREVNDLSQITHLGNAGFGYRYLAPSQRWMLGVNIFYDAHLRHPHRRLGVGIEAMCDYATLRVNTYQAISGQRTVSRVNAGPITEKAMSGADIELEVPVPFIPWARVGASAYRWDTRTTGVKDIVGQSAFLRAWIVPYLSMEVGRNNNHINPADTYVELHLSLGHGGDGIEHSMTTKIFDRDQVFQGRDLSQHTLDYVQRDNGIDVEQTIPTSGSLQYITVHMGRAS